MAVRGAIVCICGLLTACSVGSSPPAGETDAAACSDGADNDADGLVDCADPACSVHAWCAGTSQDAGTATDAGPRPDRYVPPATCSDPIDVVFVIDVSTSMADEVDGIRRGVESIWNAARSLTTNTQFGLVVFVDDAVAVNDCAPFATIEAMQAELADWQAFTSSNGQPGGGASSNSDCPENSLDALHLAATACPWRSGSTRILIHVTDDTFAEHPDRLSGVLGFGGIEVQHTYAQTVAALVEREIRVGAFAAPGAGEYCGAGTSPDVGRGFHAPYMGMPSIPDSTSGRAWSIRDVRAGTLNMADAINEFAAAEYCAPF